MHISEREFWEIGQVICLFFKKKKNVEYIYRYTHIHKINFDESTTQLIQKIPLSRIAPKDCWIWISDKFGEFLVKSAYWLGRNISHPTNQDAIHGLIWKSKIHERLKMHLWRISANCLPTKACLARFCELDDVLCPLCKDAKESGLHLFISCTFTRVVWFNY